MTTTPLNLDRFTKVCALIDRGGTEGECAAARRRAAAMAEAAGVSLEDARAAAVELEQRREATNFLDVLTPEERFAAVIKRLARRRAVIEEYGGEGFIWEPSSAERALEDAINCLPHAGKWADVARCGEIPNEARQAAQGALPWPKTLGQAWAEWQAWDKLSTARDAVSEGYSHDWGIRVRVELLEDLLEALPAQSLDDIRIRSEYAGARWFDGFGPSEDALRRFLGRLRSDVATIGARASEVPPITGVQLGRRTNADKRNDVLSMLDSADGANLSDREIARRVGVSPQTVNTLRRSRRRKAL